MGANTKQEYHTGTDSIIDGKRKLKNKQMDGDKDKSRRKQASERMGRVKSEPWL